MTKQLTVIAHIVAKPDKIDLTRQTLLGLIEKSRNDKGCIDYHLHQDDSNPAEFTFYENWASRADWDVHMEAPHLKEFFKIAPELFAVDAHVRLMTMASKR